MIAALRHEWTVIPQNDINAIIGIINVFHVFWCQYFLYFVLLSPVRN